MARWKPDEFSDNLIQSVKADDHRVAKELCQSLVEHLRARVDPYPEDAATKDLSTLRRKRYFDLMVVTGDAFIRSGLRSPEIRRQYAQALLDQGNVSAGLAILEPIPEEPGVSQRERAEAKGLIGRAYKQIYSDAGDWRPPHNREAITRAIDAYYEVYTSNKERFLWQGVNAVSLLVRAQRDGLDVAEYPDAQEIAKEIVKEVEARDRAGTINMWDLATVAEAQVALEHWDKAASWLKMYVEDKHADAFELASTTRQFEEVIQLDRDEGNERYLMDMLRSQLLRRAGGGIIQDADELRERASSSNEAMAGLEKVLGTATYQPHQWMLRGFRRAQMVGRVWHGGRGIGTGFLLPGRIFARKEWHDSQVFLTNSHVISKDPVIRGTLRPRQAEITFDALHASGVNQPRFRVKKWLWESAIGDLDTTVLQLDNAVEGPEEFPVATRTSSMEAGDRVYIIGHPHGGELAYSLQDNELLARNESRIHYRSPTDPGSSGSPLFDENWDVIGIHHAGDDFMPRLDHPDKTYPANEGIPLAAIAAAAGQG